jgi:hypothetical protein
MNNFNVLSQHIRSITNAINNLNKTTFELTSKVNEIETKQIHATPTAPVSPVNIDSFIKKIDDVLELQSVNKKMIDELNIRLEENKKYMNDVILEMQTVNQKMIDNINIRLEENNKKMTDSLFKLAEEQEKISAVLFGENLVQDESNSLNEVEEITIPDVSSNMTDDDIIIGMKEDKKPVIKKKYGKK